MQATEILFSLGGRLVNVMCLFICIVCIFYYYYYSNNNNNNNPFMLY